MHSPERGQRAREGASKKKASAGSLGDQAVAGPGGQCVITPMSRRRADL